MQPVEAAHQALEALRATLDGIETSIVGLTVAALRFDIAEVIALTAAIDRAQDTMAQRQASAAAALGAAQRLDIEATREALRAIQHDIRARVQRIQEAQIQARTVVQKARSFAAAHERVLVAAPSTTTGYTRRAVAATEPSLVGALHDAAV